MSITMDKDLARAVISIIFALGLFVLAIAEAFEAIDSIPGWFIGIAGTAITWWFTSTEVQKTYERKIDMMLKTKPLDK